MRIEEKTTGTKENIEFKKRMKRMYETSPLIAERYPFDKTWFALKTFMEERESPFLNPYDFGGASGLSREEAVSLFFLLAVMPEAPILRIQYQFTCEQGIKSVLYDKDLLVFHCQKECPCETPVNLAEAMVQGTVTAIVYFELHPSLLETTEKGE